MQYSIDIFILKDICMNIGCIILLIAYVFKNKFSNFMYDVLNLYGSELLMIVGLFLKIPGLFMLNFVWFLVSFVNLLRCTKKKEIDKMDTEKQFERCVDVAKQGKKALFVLSTKTMGEIDRKSYIINYHKRGDIDIISVNSNFDIELCGKIYDHIEIEYNACQKISPRDIVCLQTKLYSNGTIKFG